MFQFFSVLLIFLAQPLWAEEKLELKQIIRKIPSTTKLTFENSFSNSALPYWGAIAGPSLILYRYDEEIFKEFEKKGRDWGVGNEDNTRSAISVSGHEFLRLPSGTGSFLYFLGDGWMHASIGGAFLSTGQLSNDHYAFNTGVMIWHGMVVSTIFNQILKRSWGRESPEVSTHQRGNTRPFPSFNDYNSKTASYDAMPSGHVMTATLTFTIISERYPQYNDYTYPIAGIWISALMFQMVNNGVHWASDYPLGIAMGYVFGKYATQMVQSPKDANEKSVNTWKVLPTLNGVYAMREF